MLVVIGIIGLVVALSLPLLAPMMRTRKLDAALDTVKSACILARSKAIRERRMMNVTLLQQTDATHGAGIVITDYDTVAGAVTGAGNAPLPFLQDSSHTWSTSFVGNNVSIYFGVGSGQTNSITAVSGGTLTLGANWSTIPAAGSIYLIVNAFLASSPAPPYCVHYLGNYGGNADVRFAALKANCMNMGDQVRYLPDGCQFDFRVPPNPTTPMDPTLAWTYVFLPTGQAWTLPPNADNLYNDTANGSQWYQTTYVAGGTLTGPTVYGPQNQTSAGIVVYATTGQVVSR